MEYCATMLPNGYVRVDHRPSGLVYLYRNWCEIAEDLRAGFGWAGAARAARRYLSATGYRFEVA